MYLQAYTLYSSVRPFGVSTLLGSIDRSGPQLYMLEPSGLATGYRATAVGKGKLLAKTELEKLDFERMTMKDAVMHAARMFVPSPSSLTTPPLSLSVPLLTPLPPPGRSIHKCHADEKDKTFELELTWICPESNGRHVPVPAELVDEAERLARQSLEDEMED